MTSEDGRNFLRDVFSIGRTVIDVARALLAPGKKRGKPGPEVKPITPADLKPHAFRDGKPIEPKNG